MFISYFDETGDDGYPKSATQLFVLTSGSIHHDSWKEVFKTTMYFRQELKKKYGLPIKLELHTRYLILNKNPYRQFGWSDEERLSILKEYADFIASLQIEFINVVINKKKINQANKGMYSPVLDAALKFNVQRIENTIKASGNNAKFLIISDEGRIGTMRKTTRRIQQINFIPSKTGSGTYRNEINLLIEDPLEKDSKQSFFIQFCDYVSFFCYLYSVEQLGAGTWHNRLSWLTKSNVENILDRLLPVLNLKANSGINKYGFVIYPK